MNLKFGIAIFLFSSIICSSLTEETKNNGTTVSISPRNPRAIGAVIAIVLNAKKFVDVMSSVLGFITGIDGVINLVKDDGTEEFRREVTAKLEDISKGIMRLENEMERLHRLVVTSTRSIIKDNRLQNDKLKVEEYNSQLYAIESMYRTDFAPILPNLTLHDSKVVNEHLSQIVGNGKMKEVLDFVTFRTKVPNRELKNEAKNIFARVISILKEQKVNHLECNDFSAYDKLFYYFKFIIETITQGYNMLLWAYQYKRLAEKNDNGIYRRTQLAYVKSQKEDIIRITDAVRDYLNISDTVSWRSGYACDPKQWIEGKNYITPKIYNAFRFSEPLEEYLKEKPTADLTILNLMPSYCDTSKFEVITSARFYESNGILGIEPQCGIFVNGSIDPRSLRWQTSHRDLYTRKNPPLHHIVLTVGRLIYLDDIVLPDGQFLTGIGFKIPEGSFVISLVAYGTKMYDFSGNDTDIGKTFSYYKVRNRDNAKQELGFIHMYKLATGQSHQTYEMTQPGTSIIFLSYCRGCNKDRYVNTPGGPFFDASVYETPIKLPLGGIGLMYKSVPDHLGLLALKFISTKFTSYIREDYYKQLASEF